MGKVRAKVNAGSMEKAKARREGQEVIDRVRAELYPDWGGLDRVSFVMEGFAEDVAAGRLTGEKADPVAFRAFVERLYEAEEAEAARWRSRVEPTLRRAEIALAGDREFEFVQLMKRAARLIESGA